MAAPRASSATWIRETGVSFAFLTNGYPMSGYDYSRLGVNRIVNLANLGNDLVG